MRTFVVERESRVSDSARAEQVRGMFDIWGGGTEKRRWNVALPLEGKPWGVGLIVGPSGCGKTTIAGHVWPEETARRVPVERSLCVLDNFPGEMPVKEVIALLNAVGFNSVPAWLRPFGVLSTGEQFRARLALALASPDPLVVFDEYTSVVDRTVARVASAAVAKAVRRLGRQFVAVTCHEDVEAWLDPDWVYRPGENHFSWRLLRGRPRLDLTIFRCSAQAWDLFRPHHYLSGVMANGPTCFLATHEKKPVCFSAWLPFVGRGNPARREHRTVVLPDYQGVGVGNAVSDYCASLWRGLGYRVYGTTSHPAMIARRRKHPELWSMRRPPGMRCGSRRRDVAHGVLRHADARMTAGFEYVGPAMSRREAELVLRH